MMNIPATSRNTRSWLPLILGAIALITQLGCGARESANADSTVPESAGARVAGSDSLAVNANARPAAVIEFVNFIAARDTVQEAEGNHQYSATGMRLLASALESMAGTAARTGDSTTAVNVTVYVDSMRNSVGRLQQTTTQDQHAQDVKAGLSAAVSALEQMDRAGNRTRDMASLRAIYNELNSTQPLRPQLSVVQRFFEAARDALQQ
ncbi:MAG: hypothetical protein H7Z40_06445 [Phycisphaerae bacterium]|nr:hypothetical protein [Gemmatimonadaceae bacterium]